MKQNVPHIVVGSSNEVARALLDTQDCRFLGRTNPHNAANWTPIDTLATEAGIFDACQKLKRTVARIDSQKISLVCLQGVSSENWSESFHVNLLSAFYLSRAFCESISEQAKIGCVVFVGSLSSYIGGKAQYASTKAALVGLMNSMNGQHAPAIRFNLIVPGAFHSGMTKDWSEEKIKKVSSGTYVHRLATRHEIADAIQFLSSNDYVSGAVLNMSAERL